MCSVEAGENFRHACVERVRVDRCWRFAHDRRAGHQRHVARHLDVNRPRFAQAAREHARDVGRRARGVVESRLVAGNLAVNLQLRVEAFRLVMQQQSARRFAAPRSARDHHQRRFFGVRAGNRVDHIERTRAIGDGCHAGRARNARRRIGREADGGLVAQRVQGQNRGLLDHLEKRQYEIAGDAEDLARAVIYQCMEKRLGKIHGETMSSLSPDIVRCDACAALRWINWT